jgi:cytochrome P450
MTAWSAIHLADRSDLLDRARAEVASACDKYATDKAEPLLIQLATLPLEAWEKGLPFLDAVLRETIRLHMYACSTVAFGKKARRQLTHR